MHFEINCLLMLAFRLQSVHVFKNGVMTFQCTLFYLLVISFWTLVPCFQWSHSEKWKSSDVYEYYYWLTSLLALTCFNLKIWLILHLTWNNGWDSTCGSPLTVIEFTSCVTFLIAFAICGFTIWTFDFVMFRCSGTWGRTSACI